MKAVGEELEEGREVIGGLEYAIPVLLWKLQCHQMEQLIYENWPFDLNALCEEVENFLREFHVNRGLRKMKVLGLRYQRGRIEVQEHYMIVDNAKAFWVFSQKVGELLDMLSADVTHLRRCLRPMSEQRLNGNFRSSAILQQFL